MRLFLIVLFFLSGVTHAASEPPKVAEEAKASAGAPAYAVSKFALDVDPPTGAGQSFKGMASDDRPYYFQAVSLTDATLKSLKAYCDDQKALFEEYQSKTLPSLGEDERIKKTPVVERSLSVLEDLYKSADQWYWDSCDRDLYDNWTDERANDNWIMSILQKDSNQPLMRVCVISNTKSPYTHHIGICHSFTRFMDNSETRPKGLAMALHGFAASFMIKRNPARTHMLTAPTEFMTDMLRITFGRDFRNATYTRATRARGATLSIASGELIFHSSWISRLDRRLTRLKATSLKAMQALLAETLGESKLSIQDLYTIASEGSKK